MSISPSRQRRRIRGEALNGAARDSVNGKASSCAGLKILVVDDELDARELVKRILTSRGAHVLTAASAAEGLEMIKIKKPDLIVSDIGMPGKNGYEFIREVRDLQVDEAAYTPAIALTAFAHSDDISKALDAGFQGHVTKPVDSFQLITVVRELTELK